MRFVWISEKTAIISLHSINLLIFITEPECVNCAVRTVLYIYIYMYIDLSLQKVNTQGTPKPASSSTPSS